jgi:hypothetical protein
MLMVGNVALTFAQNDTVLYMVNHPSEVTVCLNRFDGATIYGPECQNYLWTIRYNDGYEQHPEGNPINITGVYGDYYFIAYNGCDFSWSFYIYFADGRWVPTSFTQEIWKHQNETITLEAVGVDSTNWYTYLWTHSNENTRTVDVTNDSIYTVQIYDLCGTAIRTFIVRDNVEIYRSGVDPATNKNKVRWNTTPQQATYVSSVKIERDGMVVGTVPYLDGEFLDNIGSENAARVYKLTAIDTDGNECPLPSYQFGTFNTIISPDIANPSLMNFTWEDPFIEEGSPYSVVAYRIGRFNEATGEFIMIDQLSANVHIGKYNMDLFDGDYGIVAAVFNDAKNRDYEELAFSNRSDNEIVGIGETQAESFEVYPNPSNGKFTVKGTGTLRIANVLGQEIMAMEIDGKETIELPKGMYFVQLNGTVRKIVVE